MKSPHYSSFFVNQFSSVAFFIRTTRSSVAKRIAILLVGFGFGAAQICRATEQGDDNPTGVSGIYNGQVTTAGSYDPFTGNAMRVVDDIVVPGSVGAYPLKWTRYFNSHVTWQDNKMGGSWRFSYLDYRYLGNDNPCYPDGRRVAVGNWGIEESWDLTAPGGLRTPDGGKIVYSSTIPYYYQGQWYNDAPTQYNYPTQIIDPYGQATILTWVAYGNTPTAVLIRLDRVTEPGGRYLKVNWDATNSVITSVQAFDGVNSQPLQSVTYTWSNFNQGGIAIKVLTRVDYNDGTYATYTYADKGYPGPPICSYPWTPINWHSTVLATADDVRYNGPMRQIKYQYYSGGNQTRIASENNLVTGEAVSTIAGVGNKNTQQGVETRGDGATRSFSYFKGVSCRDCPPPDTEPCNREPLPTDGKLSSYTDFLGHITTLTYESDDTKAAAGYITAVTDANGNTTTYTRSARSWGILRVTFPPTPTEPLGSHIDQTFTDEAHPYYLASRTDELGRTVVYTRDLNTHIITRKDYPTPDATTLNPSPSPVYETFTYNKLNQVLTHRLTNGGVEVFGYDLRGLKTSYTDPLGNNTTYTYYTTGPWTDRLQTVTYPANASGVRATETYDYDRAYDANGENSGASTGQPPVAGRGLVTRITHADGKYEAFGYDQYGNKVWQEDELRHRTRMVYDAYNRVLTTTDPLGHTVTNNYVPTGKTSTWITTSSLPFSITLPSTKKTTFYYDGNWQKTRMQQAPGTADEANTYFTYDNLGNLLTTQDPRGNTTTNVYDARNRLVSTTDALTHATTFSYDAHGNKLTTTKANGEVITNVYDKLNRVIQVRTTRDANTIDIRNSAYDAAGNLIKFQDENATARGDTTNIYAYTYDFRNRILSMIYPNMLHEDTTYDNAGNILTYRNRANITKTFSQFDNRNRPHRFDWSDGVTPWQTTNYDDASRITQITNSISTINNTYLNDNRLSTQEEWTSAFNDNVHRTVSYTYDVDGNRQSITYPSGTAFNYTYTNRNQVSAIKPGLSGGAPVVSYAYDPSGNVINRALDNTTSTAYTVDQINRDISVVHSLAGATRRFDYAYNSVNDILAVQRDSALGDGYTYDLTQEILRFAQNGTVNLGTGAVTNPQTNTTMTFDGCGNQKSLNGSGTFAVDYLNEYNTFNGAPVTNDNEGNLLAYNGWNYTYDAQNRLTAATLAGMTIATFAYDGLNRQIARSINGTITFSVWDGDWAILEEYRPSNAVTQKYLQGVHGLVKTLPNNIYYYQDELGSTSHITNSAGALLEYYKYDLYGKPTFWSAAGSQLQTSNTRDLFTGQRWLPELGLYDDRNRFMSPALGRFIQPDPIGFKGDPSNLYRYVGNDWANRADPMGTDSTEKCAGNTMWQQAQRETFNDHDMPQHERGEILEGVGHHFTMQIRNPLEDMDAKSGQLSSLQSRQSIGTPVEHLNTVTITLYNANGGLNHIGLGVDTSPAPGLSSPAAAPTMGFYPQRSASQFGLIRGRTYPGHMERDSQRVIASHSIPISQIQADLMARNQNYVIAHPGGYNLYGTNHGNNCVVTAANTLRAGGIPVPQHGPQSYIPNNFFDYLFQGH